MKYEFIIQLIAMNPFQESVVKLFLSGWSDRTLNHLIVQHGFNHSVGHRYIEILMHRCLYYTLSCKTPHACYWRWYITDERSFGDIRDGLQAGFDKAKAAYDHALLHGSTLPCRCGYGKRPETTTATPVLESQLQQLDIKQQQ